MKKIYVSSRDLSSIGYDTKNCVLEVEFLSGDIYQYFNVPYRIFAELTKSNLDGTLFHNWISRSYKYKKLPQALY